jgi:hypothetical protein
MDLELVKDRLAGAGYLPRGVEVLNSDEPLTAVGACVEPTCEGGRERPDMKWAGWRGSETRALVHDIEITLADFLKTFPGCNQGLFNGLTLVDD